MSEAALGSPRSPGGQLPNYLYDVSQHWRTYASWLCDVIGCRKQCLLRYEFLSQADPEAAVNVPLAATCFSPEVIVSYNNIILSQRQSE